MDIVILSTSDIKTQAISLIIEKINSSTTTSNKCSLRCVAVPDNLYRVEQPIGKEETKLCALMRVDSFLNGDVLKKTLTYDSVLISVENGIVLDEERQTWSDVCVIGCYLNSNEEYHSIISSIKIPISIQHIMMYNEFFRTSKNVQITFGKFITEHHPNFKNVNPKIPHNNWMKVIAKIDRVDQISYGIEEIMRNVGLIE